jgi:hypothetical protein
MDSIRADSVEKDTRSLGAMLDSSSEPVVLADSHALVSIGIFEHRHLTTQVTINKVYHTDQSGERDVDRDSPSFFHRISMAANSLQIVPHLSTSPEFPFLNLDS